MAPGRRGPGWAGLAATLALLAALLAALPLAAPRAQESALNDAERAYAAQRYAEARRLWTPLAEAGDHQAQLGLATLHDLGQGLPRDAAAAYAWYLRAAQDGVPRAEFNVAVMLDSGDGTTRDRAGAAVWYARAAAHGNHRAQYNLGQLYAAGQGVPRNLDQAEAWFQAAAAELPAAAGKLAQLRRRTPSRKPAEAEDQSLLPVQLAAPADGEAVPGLAAAEGAVVELVWTAPAQPAAARFFVQVLAIGVAGSAAETREVFSTYLDETAVLAPVARPPGRYAWRVYTVARDLGRYVASEWARFSVAAPSPRS